jgi:hypothetical protein
MVDGEVAIPRQKGKEKQSTRGSRRTQYRPNMDDTRYVIGWLLIKEGNDQVSVLFP